MERGCNGWINAVRGGLGNVGDIGMNNKRKLSEWIICAAIHWRDGVSRPESPTNIDSGLVICGRRHHNALFISKKVWDYVREKPQWRPSIHMPEWAARYKIKITDVSVKQIDGVWMWEYEREVI